MALPPPDSVRRGVAAEPEDPFKRFKRRDVDDDSESGKRKQRRREDDDDDSKSSAKGGAPLGLILGLLVGSFLLCGCCGVGGYGVYALEIFGTSSQVEIVSARRTNLGLLGQYSVEFRVKSTFLAGYTYHVVAETRGTRSEFPLNTSGKGNSGRINWSGPFPAGPPSATRFFVERRNSGNVKVVSNIYSVP
jgi:hypothetical protein